MLLPVIIRRDFPASAWNHDGTLHHGAQRRRSECRRFTPILERYRLLDVRPRELVSSCCVGCASPLGVMFAARSPSAFTAGPPPPLLRAFGDRTAWYVTGFMGLTGRSRVHRSWWLPTLLRDADRRSRGHTSCRLCSDVTLIHARIAQAVPRRGLSWWSSPSSWGSGLLMGPSIYTDLGSRAWAWSGRLFGLALLFISTGSS